jgi:hypothetical protein
LEVRKCKICAVETRTSLGEFPELFIVWMKSSGSDFLQIVVVSISAGRLVECS